MDRHCEIPYFYFLLGLGLRCYKCDNIEMEASSDLLAGTSLELHTNKQCSSPDRYDVDTETCPDFGYVCGVVHGSVSADYGSVISELCRAGRSNV